MLWNIFTLRLLRYLQLMNGEIGSVISAKVM